MQWTPRILCILAILMLSLLAFDSFSPERNFLQNTAAFLIHLIPSFVLLAVLILSWKHEKAGGIIFLILGLAAGIYVFNLNAKRFESVWIGLRNALIICLPFVVAAILFLVSYTRKRKELSV